MTETTDFTDEILNNPLSTQKIILEDYEDRIDGGGIVVDANNTFMYLIEAMSRLSGRMTEDIDNKLRQVYPRRAMVTKDLYNHISDYDYVGFYSGPSTLPMRLILHRDYIIEKAVPVPGTNYAKIVIPKDTTFEVGNYSFSLYYPIEIRVNTVVNSVSAAYNTEISNPLYTLNTNSIAMTEMENNGIKLLAFEFDTFQFKKDIITEPINVNMGFIKKYKFTDKFYAVRVWDTVSGVELATTMSDEVYDPSNGTCILKVYPEDKMISLDIPQIYFNNGIVGNQIKIELYTTLGEVDINLSTLKLDDVKANFALDVTDTDKTYTSVLRNIPTIIIVPISQRVKGGHNGYSFGQMKDSVVYHNGSQSAPITNMDLNSYFNKHGFKACKKTDNLTDRRYYAYRQLTLEDDLAVSNSKLTIKPDELHTNNGVRRHGNDKLVMLPSVRYRYKNAGNQCLPMDDVDIQAIDNLNPAAQILELNQNQYVTNPYHIVLRMHDRYPDAKMYDMFDVYTSNIAFLKENINLSAQLNVASVQITHDDEGCNGYSIRVGITKSEVFDEIPIADRKIYLSVRSVTNSMIGIEGTYSGEYEDLSTYDFHLDTEYNIDEGMIEIDNLINIYGSTLSNQLNLKDKFYISTMVKHSHFPTIAQDTEIINYFVENDNEWLMVSLQSVDYQLGVNLDDVLDTNLLVNWSNEQYRTYDEEELLRYEHDVYETDDDGNMVYIVDGNGDVITTKLHDMGDVVLDSEGVAIVKHRVGETVVGLDGTPEVIAPRITDYTIDLSTFDYRNHKVTKNFHKKVAGAMSDCYPNIRIMDENILENTKAYFKPITTLGETTYKLNNNVSKTDKLDLGFKFKIMVKQSVFSNAKLIKDMTKKVERIVSTSLADKIISLTAITNTITEQLGDYIESIDIIDLNGDTSVQTLVNTDVDKSPCLGKKLKLDDSGEMKFVNDVEIDFQPLDM